MDPSVVPPVPLAAPSTRTSSPPALLAFNPKVSKDEESEKADDALLLFLLKLLPLECSFFLEDRFLLGDFLDGVSNVPFRMSSRSSRADDFWLMLGLPNNGPVDVSDISGRVSSCKKRIQHGSSGSSSQRPLYLSTLLSLSALSTNINETALKAAT